MLYSVTSRPGAVDAWAEVCLPFEPTGAVREYRDALRAACRTLVAAPGEVLHAEYGGAGPVDLENVLTYNVGGLAAATRYGFVLERADAEPDGLHRHRYALGTGPWRHWSVGQPLASVAVPADRALLSGGAGAWWLATRRAGVAVRGTAAAGPIAVRVTVDPDPAWRGGLLGLVKPLVDGVLSALHRAVDPGAAVVDRVAALDVGLTRDEAADLLTGPASLGPARLVVLRGDGLQWLPADDRVVVLDVRRGTPGPGRVAVDVAEAARA